MAKPTSYHDIPDHRRKGLWEEPKPPKSTEIPKESRYIRDNQEHDEYLRNGYIIKDDNND
jgi:hypothetical protein